MCYHIQKRNDQWNLSGETTCFIGGIPEFLKERQKDGRRHVPSSLPLKYSAVTSSDVARSTTYRPSELPIQNQLLSLQGPQTETYGKTMLRGFLAKRIFHLGQTNDRKDQHTDVMKWQDMYTIKV